MSFWRVLVLSFSFLLALLNLLQFESPLWAGRLPLRVGEPAGGSLTADEYKFAVTGPWAIVVCKELRHQVITH